MNYWLLIIPFMAALVGWGLNHVLIYLLFYPVKPQRKMGLTLQGLLPKKQPAIACHLAKYISSQIPLQQIEAQITHPGTIEKLMPFVEKEIDHFLRTKLAEQMPMISMFIGEKTIIQLKTVFLEEIKTLFPQLISNYMHTLTEDFKIEVLVAQKIAAIPAESLAGSLQLILKNELRLVKITGAVTGFLIGCLQLVVTWLLL